MRILVTGANGQLGREIAKQGTEHELILTDRYSLNITNLEAVHSLFKEVKPQAVIHCAAYTQVDQAEDDRDEAFRVNVVGAQNIASKCLEINARMVYISTDYVFDGAGQKPYREFDAVNPQTVYGRTKWQGEEIIRQILGSHYIVRTAWLYGEGSNFVKTMINLAKDRDELRVVHDQVGTPTSTVDVAKAVFALLKQGSFGTYHATCQGACSWYDFACEIFRQMDSKVRVIPVTTEEFKRSAKRPAYSVLDNYMLRMTVGDPMRSWQEALKEYLMKY